MIKIPTVLILGAGSSVHVGYPLGGELINRLCQLRGTIALDKLPVADWTRNRAELFLTRLSRSGHYSIDAFLEENQDDAPLGKYLIARELKINEILDKLFPPYSSGWYQYLFNSLLIAGHPEFAKNLTSIVTFNYDRSLEAYIYTALQNRFRMSESEATQVLQTLSIIHAHGILGKYPDIPYSDESTTQELLSISNQIQIVYELQEQDGHFCNPMFKDAHDKLKNAERIFFLGFGFHLDNIRRFQFFNHNSTKGKMIRSTNLGVGPRELEYQRSTFEKYGFPPETFQRVTACNDFFQFIQSLE